MEPSQHDTVPGSTRRTPFPRGDGRRIRRIRHRRQVFGLTGADSDESTAADGAARLVLTAVASQVSHPVPVTAVVPVHRCGTVPDSHRVPSHPGRGTKPSAAGLRRRRVSSGLLSFTTANQLHAPAYDAGSRGRAARSVRADHSRRGLPTSRAASRWSAHTDDRESDMWIRTVSRCDSSFSLHTGCVSVCRPSGFRRQMREVSWPDQTGGWCCAKPLASDRPCSPCGRYCEYRSFRCCSEDCCRCERDQNRKSGTRFASHR